MSTNKTRDYGDLRITMTYDFDWSWDTGGMGCQRGVTGWHAKPQGDLRALGTYAEPGGYHDINQKRAMLLVGSNPNASPSKPAVKSPDDYTRIWIDEGGGGQYDGTFWRPVAPTGYKSLGDVIVASYTKPSVDKIWCVREDLVTTAQFPASSLWDDAGGGGKYDGAIWNIIPSDLGIDGNPNVPLVADTFRAFNNYRRPAQETANVLILSLGRDYGTLDTSVPNVTKNAIPPRGKQYDYKEQCKITLPFTYFFKPTDGPSLQNISDPFCTLSKAIAWFVEGVWVNNADGAFTRSQRLLCGVSKEKRTEMTNSVGVDISATYGIKAVESTVTLNYQFTHSSSATFTEYSEREVTETFEVPAHTAKVLFTKHVWVKGSRSDGSVVMNQLEFTNADEVYYSGCNV
ncbi:MAG: hypothetical protein Q9220_004285 [cf. Caloplaca sp. 1 TL-2023]